MVRWWSGGFPAGLRPNLLGLVGHLALIVALGHNTQDGLTSHRQDLATLDRSGFQQCTNADVDFLQDRTDFYAGDHNAAVSHINFPARTKLLVTCRAATPSPPTHTPKKRPTPEPTPPDEPPPQKKTPPPPPQPPHTYTQHLEKTTTTTTTTTKYVCTICPVHLGSASHPSKSCPARRQSYPGSNRHHEKA